MWLGRYLVKRAAWALVVALVGILLVWVGSADARGLPGPGPQGVALSVPCVGPDDPPGCDPEEPTPTPDPTPTPTPEPTPTPTPTPSPTPLVVVLSPADADRLDRLAVIGAAAATLLVFAAFVIAATTGLRS